MKKCLKKILIIAMAVACACSVHITVNAEETVPNNWGSIEDLINQLIGKLDPDATTTAPETTTQDPNATTTADQNTTTTNDPVNNTVTGTVTTTAPSTAYPTVDINNSNNNNNNSNNNNDYNVGELTTAAPLTTEPFGEEDRSNGSLSDLLEQDSAAIIIQAPHRKVHTQYRTCCERGYKKRRLYMAAGSTCCGSSIVCNSRSACRCTYCSAKQENQGRGRGKTQTE